MSGRRTPNPSPLAGEAAARSAAGEGLGGEVLRGGWGSRGPSPARSLRSRSTSPVKGEGKKKLDEAELHRRARGLRSRLTNAERKLWYALRDRRFEDFKFRRQFPIGRFIADFVCFEARLVIEVDGGQHVENARDQYRDRWFTANGFRVLRFWNNEVLTNLEGVLTVLAEALAAERTP
jgi:very-short-patch-repair endonuclease